MTTSTWTTLNNSEMEIIKQKLTDKLHSYFKILENNLKLKFKYKYEYKTAKRYEINIRQ